MPPSTLFVGPLDRVLYFRTIPAFEHLSSTELAAIAQHANEEFYPAGRVLLERGEPADAVFLLIDGLVSLTRGDKPAKQLGAGEAVGFLELLARTGEEMYLRVERDTLALKLDWDAQLDVCEEHFGILLEYIRYLSRRKIEESATPAPSDSSKTREPTPAEPGPRHFVKRVLALQQCTAFPTEAMDALAELARHVKTVDWPAGGTIWQTGDSAHDFLAMLSGRARCAGTRDGSRTVYRTQPDTLGMHETLAGMPRYYDAVAADDVTALKIELEPFLDILEDHFDLAMEFTSLMARGVLGAGTEDKGVGSRE